MKPKLELIYPTHRKFRHLRFRNLVPPLNLCLLAALTPREFDVRITDAYVEHLDFERPVDLVGITAVTASAIQAYRIADEYRRRGVKVVMGGIHPTAMPDEALEHSDAVVLGEAEGIWKKVLDDFLAGRLSGIYKSESYPSLAGLPLPRRDLVRRDKYFFHNLVETGRGCPFRCYYCSDWIVYGRKYRFRPAEEVVEEIRSLGRRKFIVFVDNNIVGNPQRAKELFRALMPLRIHWVAQASITMAEDRELVNLAARSGCLGVLVGLETLKKDLLRKIGKPVDPAKYKQDIKTIQDAGIFVQGEFIFGFDEDDPSVFEETLKFAEEAKLAAARFAILKPYPGTKIFDEFMKTGRMRVLDWEKFHTSNVVYEPKQLSPEQLSAGRDWCYDRFASIRSIYRRVGFFRKNAWLLWLVNLANRSFKNTRIPSHFPTSA